MIVQEPRAFDLSNNPRANQASITAPVGLPTHLIPAYPRFSLCLCASVASPSLLFSLPESFRLSTFGCRLPVLRQPLSFQSTMNSLPLSKTSTPLFSVKSELFDKNTRGGVYIKKRSFRISNFHTLENQSDCNSVTPSLQSALSNSLYSARRAFLLGGYRVQFSICPPGGLLCRSCVRIPLQGVG